MKIAVESKAGEERQAKTVEPLIRVFHEMGAGNRAERQHHAKD